MNRSQSRAPSTCARFTVALSPPEQLACRATNDTYIEACAVGKVKQPISTGIKASPALDKKQPATKSLLAKKK